MLLQSDLNKWWLTLLVKIDKMYINSASTRILQISKTYHIEYEKKIFPKNSHIYIRACGAASSYHCPSPIEGSNIPK